MFASACSGFVSSMAHYLAHCLVAGLDLPPRRQGQGTFELARVRKPISVRQSWLIQGVAFSQNEPPEAVNALYVVVESLCSCAVFRLMALDVEVRRCSAKKNE